MNKEVFEKEVERALLKFKVSITDPFSASQCGYVGLEGYCRRRRLLNHFKPQNIEENQDIQQIFLKGYFTEIAYKSIIRDVFKERVFTKVTWQYNGIRVDPDIWIPALSKIIEIKATKKIPDTPFEQHRIQVGIQLLACPKKNATAEIHYIEYEGRKWNLKIFPVEPLSREEIDRIMQENEIVRELWENKSIPPIAEGFHHYKYPCYFGKGSKCPHWEDCWLIEKDVKDILIDDIEKYYVVKKKISELRKAVEQLEEFAKKLETFFPKEQGMFRIKDYILKVNVIPEKVIPGYVRSSYIKYTVKKETK